ncbi:hypothetical protein U1Q18_010447 [Sarracenia purpurea var. burkii]
MAAETDGSDVSEGMGVDITHRAIEDVTHGKDPAVEMLNQWRVGTCASVAETANQCSTKLRFSCLAMVSSSSHCVAMSLPWFVTALVCVGVSKPCPRSCLGCVTVSMVHTSKP